MTADAELKVADVLDLTCKGCGHQWSASLPRNVLLAQWIAMIEAQVCASCGIAYHMQSTTPATLARAAGREATRSEVG